MSWQIYCTENRYTLRKNRSHGTTGLSRYCRDTTSVHTFLASSVMRRFNPKLAKLKISTEGLVTILAKPNRGPRLSSGSDVEHVWLSMPENLEMAAAPMNTAWCNERLRSIKTTTSLLLESIIRDILHNLPG